MPIDNCSHSFSEMADQVLPDLMKQMRQSINKPVPIAEFMKPGNGIKRLLANVGLSGDFPGSYVLIENGKPIYVGISRQVFRRIWLHCRGETHYNANLVYRIASKKKPSGVKTSRDKRMQDEEFLAVFNEVRSHIQQCSFAYVPIDNDLTLYLFEAYCAMELDTCEWNTFRTH